MRPGVCEAVSRLNGDIRQYVEQPTQLLRVLVRVRPRLNMPAEVLQAMNEAHGDAAEQELLLGVIGAGVAGSLIARFEGIVRPLEVVEHRVVLQRVADDLAHRLIARELTPDAMELVLALGLGVHRRLPVRVGARSAAAQVAAPRRGEVVGDAVGSLEGDGAHYAFMRGHDWSPI